MVEGVWGLVSSCCCCWVRGEWGGVCTFGKLDGSLCGEESCVDEAGDDLEMGVSGLVLRGWAMEGVDVL